VSKKEFLFLSDFDGTMSRKDFYLTFVENYLCKFDKIVLEKCLRGEITSYEYLNEILSNVNLTKEQIDTHIFELPMMSGVKRVIQSVYSFRGDFAVVSAGSSYYIRPILDQIGVGHIPLFSNGGEYVDGGIVMSYPENERYFGNYFGIDKAAVVEDMKQKYKEIIFAGDGAADFEAAKASQVRFARGVLAQKLTQAKISFHPFHDFNDIAEILKHEYFVILPC